ncbi:MAG TPA: hypothetical protein VNT55_19425 [Baekduia sp.]|nr:hypothetical protein [Baekduia sp.]
MAIPATRGGGDTPPDAALVRDDFSGPDRLVTNEHAYRDRGIPRSKLWTVTSGSLFVHDGHGWTGVPDGGSPDKRTPRATGSAIFRVVTKRRDVRDAQIAFRVMVRGLSTSSRTPDERSFDGVHVMLRYASPQALYAASVDRRDGAVLIRKKVPGGPDPANGGTWMDVGARAVNAIPVGRWQRVVVRVRDEPDGAVGFRVIIDGRTVVSARDDGVGGVAPYTRPGRIGFRCDNADVLLDGVRVTPLVNDSGPDGDRPVSVP